MKLTACLSCGLGLVVGCAYFGQPSPPVAPKDPDLIQFRLVEENDGRDTVAMKAVGSDQTFHVNKQALLNALDVRWAKASRDRHLHSPAILLSFTPEGAKKLAEVTASNINRRLAIIVDGQLLSAPIIRARIEAGEALIQGSFTGKDSTQIVRAINANVAR